MIGGTIHGGDLDGFLGMLRRLAHPDLRPLAEEIRRIIIDGNEQGLLAGLDADGRPFAELAESTQRRRLRDEGGMGPPTIPRFSASQLIDRFRVEIVTDGHGGLSIRGSWPGVPEVEFFRTGTRNMPARNPVGIRPETMARIGKAVDDFAAELVGGRSRFGEFHSF